MDTVKKKDRVGRGWYCILLGSMFFLWACSQTMEPAISQESKTRESSMNIEKGVPPLDMASPPNFETASFGLG